MNLRFVSSTLHAPSCALVADNATEMPIAYGALGNHTHLSTR